MSSPEKLDRIGEYLAQRVSRDIYRRRNAFVVIAMEAMDQLLVACHAQSLNLFVESFLKTIQKLLETTEPTLQTLASQSVWSLFLSTQLIVQRFNFSQKFANGYLSSVKTSKPIRNERLHNPFLMIEFSRVKLF